MVPTFLIDSPTAMVIGALAAILGRGGEVSSRRWLARGAIAVTVFLATALAAYGKGPDWMWMYFLDPPPLGVADLSFMAVVLYYVPYLAAFAAARSLDRAWPGRGAYGVLAISAALNVFVVARLWDRYYHVGTRAEYLTGKALPLTGDHALKGVLDLGGAALGATAVVLVILAVRESRAASRS